MNWGGFALGVFSFGVIGFGFFWVIRLEYYLGYLWWPYPMALGLFLLLGSLFVAHPGASGMLGILGASLLWGSTELKEQAVRGELGWFRFNPKRKPDPPGVAWIRKIPPPHL